MQRKHSSISSRLCQSSPCVQESTTMQACGTVDPGVGVLFLWRYYAKSFNFVFLNHFFNYFSWLIMNVFIVFIPDCVPSRVPVVYQPLAAHGLWGVCAWLPSGSVSILLWTMGLHSRFHTEHTHTFTSIVLPYIFLHSTPYVSMKIWAWFDWSYISMGPFSKGFGREKIKNKFTTHYHT